VSIDAEADFLIKLRDASAMILDACEQRLDSLAPSEAKQARRSASSISAVKEETFNILKWDPQEGAKLGAYDVAYKATNLPEKWNQAHNILRQNNAVINGRYHGQDYAFAYWLYGEDKIYRKKLA
jgi:hypothetical protein